MEVRKALIAGAFAICCGPANAQYFDYSSWTDNSVEARAVYIAGLADALTATGNGWKICLNQLRMKNGQLAENVRTFAGSRPDLHAGPVSLILMEYLVKACGMDKKSQPRN